MKIRNTILLLGILLTALILSAVPCPAEELSLADAVRAALQKNPLLQAEAIGARAAEEKMVQARAGMMPQVALSEQATQTTNPMWAFGNRLNQQAITTQDFDPARLNDPDSLSNYATVLSVNWPLYDSGQTWYGIRQARLATQMAALSLERKRQEIMADTAQAYLNALLFQENEVILDRLLTTAVSHEKLIASRYNGGFVAKSDLLRARVRIIDLKQRITQAKNQTKIALCRLAIFMGESDETPDSLSDSLVPGSLVTGTMEDWILSAREHRPDLKGGRLALKTAEAELEKAKAARLPSVGLSTSCEINSENFSETGSNYTIGAQVSLPLFTGGRTASRIREAALKVRESDMRLAAMDQMVCAETRAAFLMAQSAWERTRVTRSAIGQSEESMRIVKSRYQNGLFTVTDLLDAQTMLQQSLTEYLKSVHDYLAAAVRLTLSAGTAADETQVVLGTSPQRP